jgi:hypothetical protein
MKAVRKSTLFWDIEPCSLLKVNRRFGRIYWLHHQNRRISRARNQSDSKWQAKHSAYHLHSRLFLARLILWSWRWRQYIPSKRRLTFSELHGISIPEYSTLRNHRFENLKSYMKILGCLLKITVLCGVTLCNLTEQAAAVISEMLVLFCLITGHYTPAGSNDDTQYRENQKSHTGH